MDDPAALHRIKVGVPATVEHSSEAGPETGKWVAETTQVRALPRLPSVFVSVSSLRLTFTIQSFITFMDALKKDGELTEVNDAIWPAAGTA